MAEEQVVEQQQRLGLGAAARSQGLARYQRIDRVGQGAYGVVYKVGGWCTCVMCSSDCV